MATTNEIATVQEAVQMAELVLDAEKVKHARVIVKPRVVSRVKQTIEGGQVVFGYESLRSASVTGFIEYKTVSWVWGTERQEPGRVSVWALVLHECAHVLERATTRKGGHGIEYQKTLRGLVDRWPLSRVEFMFDLPLLERFVKLMGSVSTSNEDVVKIVKTWNLVQPVATAIVQPVKTSASFWKWAEYDPEETLTRKGTSAAVCWK